MARYEPEERFRYLRQLVTEFQDTNSMEAKEQVLANLANFAYDPVNYENFKRLNIVHLFIDQLDNSSDALKEFAMGGICNLASGETFRGDLLKPEHLQKIIGCLSHSLEDIVLSAVTALLCIGLSGSKAEVTTPAVIDCMLRCSKSTNKRLSNVANHFLEDICSPEQVSCVKSAVATSSS